MREVGGNQASRAEISVYTYHYRSVQTLSLSIQKTRNKYEDPHTKGRGGICCVPELTKRIDRERDCWRKTTKELRKGEAIDSGGTSNDRKYVGGCSRDVHYKVLICA